MTTEEQAPAGHAAQGHAAAALNRLERLTAHVLRYGVLLCSAVTACGLLLSFAAGSGEGSALSGFVQQLTAGQLISPEPNPFACAAAGVLACFADPQAVTSLGLLLLIALPILRVAMALGLFIVQKDRAYAFLSAVVLAVLLGGLVLGHTF